MPFQNPAESQRTGQFTALSILISLTPVIFSIRLNGNGSLPVRTAAGQTALLDGQPITVRNQSGGEDPFTFAQGGGTLGGMIVKEKLLYFVSGEYQKINASQEKSFAVPTIEKRGPFLTGATGTTTNLFTGQTLPAPLYPTGPRSNAVFSLFPYANNLSGIYGNNTFMQVLPAGGRGGILSGKLDDHFLLGGWQHTLNGPLQFYGR